MADTAFDRLGGVDVLVNNVGDVAREQMSWRDITEESIDHVLAVDIKGTMLCIHEFGARMLDQGHGSIVNIGSTVIVRGSARAPQYAAGKYGLLGVTKSYAHAFAPTVRVNIFAPGFIETEATLGRKDWQSGRADQLRSLTPMGRIPGPDELLAPRCSSRLMTRHTSRAAIWSPTAAITWSAHKRPAEASRPDRATRAISASPRPAPSSSARSTRPSSSACAARSPSSARAAPCSPRPGWTRAGPAG